MIRTYLVFLVIAALVGAIVPPAPRAAAQSRSKERDSSPPSPPPRSQREPVPVAPDVIRVKPKLVLPDIRRGPRQVVSKLKEVPQLRGRRSFAYSQPNGATHLVRTFAGPVNFRAGDGSWKPIDTRLVRDGNAYRNAANAFTTRFPEALTEDAPVTFQLPEGSFTTNLVGAASDAGEPDQEAILYPNALDATDVDYRLTAAGYNERVVLRNRSASPRLKYRIRTDGVTLEMENDGAVAVHSAADGKLVATMPPHFAEDSAYDPRLGEGALLYDLPTTLTQTAANEYQVSVEIPQEWYDAPERRFPIIVDPTTIRAGGHKDTFMQSDISTRRSGHATLRVGAKESDGWPRAFSYTTIVLSNVRDEGDIIEDAQLRAYNFHSYNATNQEVAVRRITGTWDESDTWPDRPSVASTVSASFSGCAAGNSGCNDGNDGWHRWNLTGLIQDYIDDKYVNKGIRLQGPGPHPQSWKKYYSYDEDVTGNAAPFVDVVVNALPSAPQFASGAIPDGGKVRTTSPSLKINNVTDPNGDNVVLHYQITDQVKKDDAGNITGADFSVCQDNDPATKCAYNMKWVDETRAHVVTPGKLKDGKTYYWRVKSWDGGKLKGNRYPTSGVRSFTIAEDKLGLDERWAMWSRELGNAMEFHVNQATGNATLNVPLDTLVVPGDELDLGLWYNHHSGMDFGLGAGWQVGAGPASDAMEIPVRLRPLGPDPTDPHSVEIVYRHGRREVYPDIGGRIFRATGADASVVRRHGAKKGWTLTTSTGGIYRFDADNKLVRAKSGSASPSSEGFSYVFDTEGRIQEVTDPMGRRITFTYALMGDLPDPRLQKITTWDGRSWTLVYDTSGMLESVDNPELETVSFGYEGAGRLDTIADGESAATGASTIIDYYKPVGAPKHGVQSIVLPDAPDPWTFSYEGPFTGTVADHASVIDPRGAPTVDEDDFRTNTAFNTQGLPIRIDGPRSPDGAWPIARRLWDANGNLLCERGPKANATAGEKCLDEATKNDAQQTEYSYQKKAPYRLLAVTEPKGDAAARLRTKYAYDAGFGGLHARFYSNPDLSGVPDEEALWSEITRDWGTGGVNNLGGQSDNFSMRWTGQIFAGHATDPKRYSFKLFAEDDGRLEVGGVLLSNCWGNDKSTYQANCGKGAKSRKLKPGWYPIVVEYQALTGNARVDLKWKKPGSDTFVTVPGTNLRPDLGRVTSVTEGTPSSPTKFSTTTFEYAGPTGHDADLAKIKGLSSKETLTGPNTTSTSGAYTYDRFGRVLTEKDIRGETITHTYQDDQTSQTSCETETIDRVGLRRTRSCNPAGDIERETWHVQEGSDETTVVDRTTEWDYDTVGRVVQVRLPDGGQRDMTYDEAGRMTEVVVKASDTAARETDYEWEPEGWLAREVLPDPDGALSAPRPEVIHRYDAVGNEIETVDARANTWRSSFSAANLELWREDPLGNRWNKSYDIAGNLQKTVSPSGVETKTTYDAAGRMTSDQVGLLTETNYVSNARGDVIKEIDPDGVYIEHTYDAAGRVVSDAEPVGATGAEKTRTYSYDGRGFLQKRTDYRGKEMEFSHDPMGRVTGATLMHDPALHDTGSPPMLRYTYNEAGELTGLTVPRPNEPDDITWTATRDRMGRLKSETDGVGNTTTYHYNDAGELEQIDDPRGITIEYDYDGRGRQVERRSVNGSGTITERDVYEYDRNDNMTAARTSARDVTMTYDSANRIDVVTAGGRTTDHDYNGELLTKRSDAAGVTSFTYQDGRVATVTDPITTTTSSYSYTDAGRVTSISDAAGLDHVLTYDGAGRFENETVTDGGGVQVASFAAAYDPNSMVTSLQRNVDGATGNGTWALDYDAAGRMSSMTAPGGTTTSFGYDLIGNREVVTKNGTEHTTIYDGAGRPSHSTTDSTTYSHDATGNLTGIDTATVDRTFSYDGFNRMTGASKGTTTSSFDHDALDRTISATSGGVATAYHHVGRDERIALAAGSSTTTYAYVGDTPVAQKVDGVTSVFGIARPHRDVTYLAGTGGAIKGTRTYDPWGELTGTTGRASDLGFQSDWTTPTGLVDMGVRDYLPDLGRFTTADPLRGEVAEPLTLNRYIYAVDSPMSFYDPLGLCAEPRYCPQQIQHYSRAERRRYQSWVAPHREREAAWHTAHKKAGYPQFTASTPVKPVPVSRRPDFLDSIGIKRSATRTPRRVWPSGRRSTGAQETILRTFVSELNRRFYDQAGSLASVPAIITGGRPRACRGGALCIEGGLAARVIAPRGAITIGHTVISQAPMDVELERHELAHVKQYEKYGWTFLPRYAWSSLNCWGYKCNIYEQRAEMAE